MWVGLSGGLLNRHRRSLLILAEGRLRESLNGNETGDVLGGMRRQDSQNKRQNRADGGGNTSNTKNHVGDTLQQSNQR